MTGAFFPISVDSKAYSTSRMIAAITAGLEEYNRIVFLVADRVQAYNRLARSVGDRDELAALDWTGSYRSDLEERRSWLRRIRNRIGTMPGDQEWIVLGVREASDWRTFEIFRSLLMLYECDPMFKADVDRRVSTYVAQVSDRAPKHEVLGLSRLFVIEECALNVRLRIDRNLRDEFYLGGTLEVFKGLYGGKYVKSASEIYGNHNKGSGSFRFFEWSSDMREWRQSWP